LTEEAKTLWQPLIDDDVEADVCEQSLDAIGMFGAFTFDSHELAVRLTSVFIIDRGDADDAPELVFATVITDQHGKKFRDVESIALGAASAAVDLDRRGVDDAVVDALFVEEAMDPEAVAPGFVAGEDLGGIREVEALLGLLDFASEGDEVASGDGPKPRLLRHRGSEGEVPGGPTELKSEVELVGNRRCRIGDVGR
jgi:hypothetical protein